MKWIFISTGFPPFNVSTPSEKSLGGIESSCCYLMNELINLEQKVEFYCQGGVETTINNIQHFSLNNFEELKLIDSDVCIFIGHTADIIPIKKSIKNIPLIFWVQHSHDQPGVSLLKNPETVKNLSGIIFVSDWQELSFINYFKLSNIKTNVIGNGITPNFRGQFLNLEDFKIKKKNTRGIYASTPFRGLEVLYESSFHLNEKIIIDVFSSMKTYSLDDNEKFQILFDKIKKNNRFNYLGSVNKKILAENFSFASFLTYPSIFAETFCITLLDSLAVGIEPIITDLGALKETSLRYGRFLSLDNDNFILNYANLINEAIKNKDKNFDEWCNKQYNQMIDVNLNHNWTKKAEKWIDIIKLFN